MWDFKYLLYCVGSTLFLPFDIIYFYGERWITNTSEPLVDHMENFTCQLIPFKIQTEKLQ